MKHFLLNYVRGWYERNLFQTAFALFEEDGLGFFSYWRECHFPFCQQYVSLQKNAVIVLAVPKPREFSFGDSFYWPLIGLLLCWCSPQYVNHCVPFLRRFSTSLTKCSCLWCLYRLNLQLTIPTPRPSWPSPRASSSALTGSGECSFTHYHTCFDSKTHTTQGSYF